MKDDVLEIVKEMSSWCFENHSINFCCEFQFVAYVNWVDIKISSGGHGNPVNVLETTSCDLTTNNDYSFKYLDDFFEGMKDFKKEHDEWFTEEGMKEREENKKQARIKHIKAELDRLES